MQNRIRITSASLGVYTPREMSAYADKMAEQVSDVKAMAMAISKLIVATESLWDAIDTVMDLAALAGIKFLRETGRALKECRQEYIDEMYHDTFMRRVRLATEESRERYFVTFSSEHARMTRAIRNKLSSRFPGAAEEALDVAAAAYFALCTYKALATYSADLDREICQATGMPKTSRNLLPPSVHRAGSHLLRYFCGMYIDKDDPVVKEAIKKLHREMLSAKMPDIDYNNL